MNINSKIESNAKKYTYEKWNDKILLMNIPTINETFTLLKEQVLLNGLTVIYHDKKITFNCLSKEELCPKWKFCNLGGDDGAHLPDENEIRINEALKNDGPSVYDTINHEFVHHLQCQLVNHINEFSIDSIEYQYLSLLKDEVLHQKLNGSAFGTEFYGNIYVNGKISSNITAISDIAESFYSLQISERNAMSTGRKAYEYVLSLCEDKEQARIDSEHKVNMQKRAFRNLKDFFNDKELTYEQVGKVIDKAKKNIVLHEAPTKDNDLEATITYMMCVILEYQSKCEKNDELAYDELKKRMNKDLIKEHLINCYENRPFALYGSRERLNGFIFSNDKFDLYRSCGRFSTVQLQELNEDVQIRNPHLIVAACLYDENVGDAIKNKYAFQTWYYSDLNELTDNTMNIVAEELGPDYSPEVKREMNAKLNEILRNERSKCDKSEYEHNKYFQERFRYDEVEEKLDEQELFEPKGPGE